MTILLLQVLQVTVLQVKVLQVMQAVAIAATDTPGWDVSLLQDSNHQVLTLNMIHHCGIPFTINIPESHMQ